MKKKLVIITGASSGIGEAAAIQFSKAGYPLLILARRLQKLKELNLPNTLCEEVDVTDLAGFKAAVEVAERKFGEVDCLINNAGVLYLGSGYDQDPNEWKKMLDINILGVLHGIHLILKKMVERQTGTIINISSIAGRKTFPNHAVYCATKFAVHALTENIREEVAEHNVRLITIAPGVVETEVLDHTTSQDLKAKYKEYKKSIRKTLQSEDIVNSILFAYEQPQHVCIREIVICPTGQKP